MGNVDITTGSYVINGKHSLPEIDFVQNKTFFDCL